MIRLHADGALATITLSRPEKKNAMTPAMLDDFAHAAAGLPPSTRALVIAGAGDAFCAGFDLPMCHADDAVLPALLRGLSGVIRTLRRLPVPVVAAAHGAAIAGGCALLCGADLVITNDDAKLGYPVVRLGVSPAVNAPVLRLAIGDGRTRERLLGGSLLSGREALACGLAHECVPAAADVTNRAAALARELAAKPPAALAATKRWLNEIDSTAHDADLDAALRTSLGIAGNEEQRRLLGAFLAKA